ncbi:hypothetical protein POSPLADRAFT_1038830 [Postia placenta MAD-698-R-SB12]|uniref:Uncharacterized protein n=1 Tax=Postia placenta MAD-698-R-SB12 TaxID=670580 RepID=A0A1X6N8G2_9APHY|nr:hypothetical protein POSPLADRAFT_1038830 [Postia placenta MAD-698-R-SB12]OSX64864.1 hypothetical protein POSPLADRAFT_1038830 [Postia placenta MAD-698-R-SB12]
MAGEARSTVACTTRLLLFPRRATRPIRQHRPGPLERARCVQCSIAPTRWCSGWFTPSPRLCMLQSHIGGWARVERTCVLSAARTHPLSPAPGFHTIRAIGCLL